MRDLEEQYAYREQLIGLTDQLFQVAWDKGVPIMNNLTPNTRHTTGDGLEALITKNRDLSVDFTDEAGLNLSKWLKPEELTSKEEVDEAIDQLRWRLNDTLQIRSATIKKKTRSATFGELLQVQVCPRSFQRDLADHMEKLAEEKAFLERNGATVSINTDTGFPNQAILEINAGKGCTVLAQSINCPETELEDFRHLGLKDQNRGLGPLHSMEGHLSNIIRTAIVRAVIDTIS